MVHQVSFEALETYVHKNISSFDITEDESKKTIFQKVCNLLTILHGQMVYKNTSLVICSTERQHYIISDTHKGLGHDTKAKALASHWGRDSTIQNIWKRFFWQNIKDDVEEFIKKRNQCQKQGKIKKVSRVNFIASTSKLSSCNRLVSIHVAFLKMMVSSI